MLSTPSKTN